jgi:hypothetical protein
MALGAQVPLVLGFVDYPRKQIGIGAIISPSEDIEETFAHIRAFYADKRGKHPECESTVAP